MLKRFQAVLIVCLVSMMTPAFAGLSVPNPTFDKTIKVAPQGAESVLDPAKGLGAGWEFLNHNKPSFGILGSTFAPFGATGNQFLYVDGRSSDARILIHLGQTDNTGPISVKLGVAARKDVAPAGYTLALYTSASNSFSGTQLLKSWDTPIPPDAGSWKSVVLSIPEVTAGKYVFMTIQSNPSGTAATQVMFDNIQVFEKALEVTATTSGAERLITWSGLLVQNPEFDKYLKLASDKYHSVTNAPGTLGPGWDVINNYKPSVGIYGSSFLPALSKGNQALFVDGRAFEAKYLITLGKNDKTGPVAVSVDIAAPNHVDPVAYTLELYTSKSADFAEATLAKSWNNPVNATKGSWNTVNIQLDNVTDGDYVFLTIGANDSLGKALQTVFHNIQVKKKALN